MICFHIMHFFLRRFDTVIFCLSLSMYLKIGWVCKLDGCLLLWMNLSRCKIVFILGLPFRSSIPVFNKESMMGLLGLNVDAALSTLSVFACAPLPLSSSSFEYTCTRIQPYL